MEDKEPRVTDIGQALAWIGETDEGFIAEEEGAVVVSGGRVLCVTALADTVAHAQRQAYEAVDAIHFDGMQCRRDIGYRAL